MRELRTVQSLGSQGHIVSAPSTPAPAKKNPQDVLEPSTCPADMRGVSESSRPTVQPSQPTRFDSHKAGSCSSESSISCVTAEPAVQTETEHDREQDMLYSSAPAALRPHALWRSAAETAMLASSTSLLNLKVVEEDAPSSPHEGKEPESTPKGETPRSHKEPVPSISGMAKTRMMSGGGAGSPSHGNPVWPANALSPRTTTQEPLQSFLAYLRAEVRAVETVPTGDVLWGQTERDRVYNFLLYVPYQLERLMQFSLFLCLDSFLGVMTLLPVRCALALQQLFKRKERQGKAFNLGGGQIFDLLCLIILVSVTVFLRTVRPGFIYYWLKDITSEFLKMSVLSTAFEIADKILSNFGMKVMEALSGTCTLWASGRLGLHHLLCDTFVAFVIVLLHALTLMCQGLVLAVALNSNRNGLLALLIASYFAEIKGVVFKRWDVERIRSLAWMDVVERFQLVCILVFVAVEDMNSSATWVPSAMILQESVWILGAEMVIDIVKHAVLGSVNDVRPGIYREYMKDLCDKVCTSQSHNLHKLLDFHHLACSALFLRSIVTLFWHKMDVFSSWQVLLRVALLLLIWMFTLVVKTLFGYTIKLMSYQYGVLHTQAHGKSIRNTSSRIPAASKRGGEAVVRKDASAGGHAKDE